MPLVWHPTRWDWCIPKDEKNETEHNFSDKAGK